MLAYSVESASISIVASNRPHKEGPITQPTGDMIRIDLGAISPQEAYTIRTNKQEAAYLHANVIRERKEVP